MQSVLSPWINATGVLRAELTIPCCWRRVEFPSRLSGNVDGNVTTICPWLCLCPCTEMESGCENGLLQHVELIDVGASCQSNFLSAPRLLMAFSPWMRPSIWIFHRISKSRGTWIDHRGRGTWIDHPCRGNWIYGRGIWIDDHRGTCSATWTRMEWLSCTRSCPLISSVSERFG